MNDSFLEDLGVGGAENKPNTAVSHAERHITTRRSHPLHACPEEDDLNLIINKPSSTSTAVTGAKISSRRSADAPDSVAQARKIVSDKNKIHLESGKPSNREINTETTKSTKVLVKKSKTSEHNLKSVQNVAHLEVTKPKLESKEALRRSVGSKDSSRCSDGSSKENSRPSDSSRESVAKVDSAKEKPRRSNNVGQCKKESEDKIGSVDMLNAIKDIVSTYTKGESTKILRAMQEFYINSQANFVMHLLHQTDDVVKEVNLGNDSSRLASLMQENERLKENIKLLQQENYKLKLRCTELPK